MTDNDVSRRSAVASLLASKKPAGNTELLPWQMPGPYGPLPVATSPLRGPINTLGVHTDGAAVAVWLADRADNSVNTAQSYRKEAERLLLWASECKGLALCQLGRADFLEFAHFLRNLPAEWIMDRRYKRTDPRWRPFFQQPSESTIAYTLGVLYGLMKYLALAGWLVSNPMPGITGRDRKVWRPVERAIPGMLLEYLFKATAPVEGQSKKQQIMQTRDRWLVTLMLDLAPRASETRVLTGKIKKLVIADRTVWFWHVMGKGGYDERIPVPQHVMDALGDFRVSLGLPRLPVSDDPIPLLPSLPRLPKDGVIITMPRRMSRNSIYKRLTECIFPAAAALAEKDGLDGSLLLDASPHWLRHSALTNIVNTTGNLKLAQKLGRHRNISTTAGYVQVDDTELLAGMEKVHQQMRSGQD